MPKLCEHPNAKADEICPDCKKKVATCAGCDHLQTLDKSGYISYHSWPPPTRRVCDGSTYSSKEDVARHETKP